MDNGLLISLRGTVILSMVVNRVIFGAIHYGLGFKSPGNGNKNSGLTRT